MLTAIRATQIDHGSPEYTQAKQLRNDVLRVPLGRVLTDQDTLGEEHQLHFVALEGDRVVGTVTMKPLSDTHIKLRQMAVSADMHGSGIGGLLIRHAESRLYEMGYRTIETAARCVAQRFYERLGYTVTGEAYDEMTVPHIPMEKSL